MSNLEYALNYASIGWHVFPCKHFGNKVKTPATMNGFKDATTDVDQITKWWTDSPKSLIGVATGKLSGFWVVDIDVKNGHDGRIALRDAFGDEIGATTGQTMRQATPTGGGHILFAWDDNNPVGCGTNILDGIDLRGEGGYIVVPPSGYFIDDKWGEYEWKDGDFVIAEAPNWARTLANMRGEKKSGGALNNTFAGLSEGKRDDEINRLAWLLSGKNIHYDIAKQVMAFVSMKCSPAFSETDALEKLDRAYASHEGNANENKPKKLNMNEIIQDLKKQKKQ